MAFSKKDLESALLCLGADGELLANQGYGQ